MALTNSRPLQIPALESENLHNSSSPVFQPSSLSNSSKSTSFESLAERSNSSLTSEGSSDHGASDTPMSRKDLLSLKRSATASPVQFTSSGAGTGTVSGAVSELSSMVPVTGQRPKPNKKDLSMDDDVLLAIFVILFEKDPRQKGVTVKQLCDYVAEKHPDMAGASTKLSNLISAKLNAYVKKVEKGEKTLKYALSRQWSEGSPRRMVYVYRGILAPDYKSHTQSMLMQRQESKTKVGKSNGSSKKSQNSAAAANEPNLEAASTDAKSANQNGRPFAISSSFAVSSFGSDFNIPYAASPVTMRLAPGMLSHSGEPAKDAQPMPASNEPATNEPATKKQKTSSDSQPVVAASMPYVTAAAAAPRLNKSTPRKSVGAQEAANAAVASIQKFIVTHKPVESTLTKSNSSFANGCSTGLTCGSWLQTVRSGFLLEEIDSPEALSVEDFEGFFK
ncbi:LADA_0F08240g1_1 [Lachancea dasiensis]|uniref:LADA_0F08240g1_1 n=1 Tax=Lachancea dasiensis TaxID=1072105 RepID=A0A1G4JKN6_9SACH|nr:LADA_0F08240g1_1 [Lachancea dasiensis]